MDPQELILRLLVGVLYAVLAAAPFAILWIGWRWLSHTLIRQERARSFLALIEIGLKQGHTPEQTVRSLAAGGVSELGGDLPALARAIEGGRRLSEALDAVPQFLPRPVRAMLRVGEEVGDLRRMLPVAAAGPATAAGETQVITNQFVVLLFVSPLGPWLVGVLAILVFPKLKQISADMLPEGSAWSPALFEASVTMAWGIFGIWMLVALVGWAGRVLRALGSSWPDRCEFLLPWRRRQMQRDFSSAFALLLDTGVPEARALRLAADCTANVCYRRQADRAIAGLARGAKLTEATRHLGGAGEFSWRLSNAAARGAAARGVNARGDTAAGRGFTAALAGWHEALAATAFRQQQTASQLVTTGFVLLNGGMVALVALGLFEMLLAIFEEAAL